MHCSRFEFGKDLISIRAIESQLTMEDMLILYWKLENVQRTMDKANRSKHLFKAIGS